MKVNERCLVQIAQSEDNPIDQCGWLHKWNDDKKMYHRKWFVLKENLLFYYNNKTDKEPLGVIILDGYRVEIIESVEERFAFKIDFGVSRFGFQLKSYVFAAESHMEMEKWIKALSCASYDYLKMVVSELQHRLDELNSFNNDSTTDNSNFINERSHHKIKIDSSISDSSQRFNPFDNCENDVDNMSFMDLHEKYGHHIRKYFH